MRKAHSLSDLEWRLVGVLPTQWESLRERDVGSIIEADIGPVPARVPGSVQGALRAAGILPDWNVGVNHRACDWVENKHWIYGARLPDGWFPEDASVRLRCQGLDGAGFALLNGAVIGRFKNSFVPHVFDLTAGLKADGNTLSIVFECPPRWLGTPGRSRDIRDWKPRFNYTWDWTPRLVQVGIWDAMEIELTDGPSLETVRLWTDRDPRTGGGSVRIHCRAAGAATADLFIEVADASGAVIHARKTCILETGTELLLDGLEVEPWHPNGAGSQPLYGLRMSLRDAEGVEHDRYECRVGFKSVAWLPCEGAPAAADPWLCEVNGKRIFIQGINWTPLLPDFADVTEEEVRRRLEVYKAMGCNLMRVWGGAVLEKASFFDLCDSMGFLVWQEFPFSSSGPENTPPSDPAVIEEAGAIASSYVERRQRHVSLLLWCGGNELQTAPDGGPGQGRPLDASFPILEKLSDVVHGMDPGRRFLPTSSSGPRFFADRGSYGKGLHWDVHGPWKIDGGREEWLAYWRDDDSLFRSEVGSPGCSPAELIRRTSGGLPAVPGILSSALWKRTSFWWLEWDVFTREKGRQPESLEEYVSWSQERQAFALVTAARRCKERFPACGGFIVWMGHDSFPCLANTAIVDFDGNPKPAALALGEVFREQVKDPE